jgi:hypothetical protein
VSYGNAPSVMVSTAIMMLLFVLLLLRAPISSTSP